jgi:hypothetical protein
MSALIGRRCLLFALLMAMSPAANAAAITGEVVETYCFAAVRVGGPAHAKCGIECAKRGIPVGIYDRSARRLYVLLPGRDKASLPPALIQAMGQQVTIQGDVVARDGSQFLTVQSWRRAIQPPPRQTSPR